jgi:hypothetical protein
MIQALPEPSGSMGLKSDAQTSDGRFVNGEARTQLPAIIENLFDSEDLLDTDKQLPSFFTSPIMYVSSSKSSLHAQHKLARACATLAIANKHKQQAPTSPPRCRPTHGQVTIKTRTSQMTGFAALLCIDKGFISVVGGAGLDDTILSMPLRYAQLKVVPGHENVLELKVRTPDAKPNGILVEVRDCSVRDRWLEAFSAIGVKIEGHSGNYSVSPFWAPSHIRFTSEAEFDQLCSSNRADPTHTLTQATEPIERMPLLKL